MPTPPASAVPAPAPAPAPAPVQGVDETGPVFLDEDPSIASEPGPGVEPGREPEREAEPVGGPEPASAWQADLSRQRGYGDDRDRQVSWGSGSGGAQDPRVPGHAADPSGGALPGMRRVPTEPEPDRDPDRSRSRNRNPESAPRDARLPAGDGTVTIRASRGGQAQAPQAHQSPQAPAAQAQPQAPAQGQAHTPLVPPQPQHPSPAAPATPSVPSQAAAPVTTGQGGGATSWPQQVQQLAQQHRPAPASAATPALAPSPASGHGDAADQQPVLPWKPPVNDPFIRAAQEKANARPAGLGRRLLARLVDSVVLGALAGAAAAPFVMSGVDHILDKIEQAKRSGETVQVWLVDGTTSVQFGIALGLLLVIGVLYEALPVAKWGRTLGKKLCGLQVRDIESHEPPSFGAALRRWLLYGVLGLLVVGVVNVLWCLVDRPWRQCWHDKAARTFVAAG